ncbi:50S ribosomal protein L3 [Smittium mucronatum]|uniref:50S ribosomal protein L3 n=1 Tax=Smittium mucronatum TaxID=133383 RepID=A0A1R0GZP7_9FUNG|nr:50S ribosomal protein L3 [Smittium mucronatum]
MSLVRIAPIQAQRQGSPIFAIIYLLFLNKAIFQFLEDKGFATLGKDLAAKETGVIKKKGKLVTKVIPGKWTPESMRTGVIAKKIGMSFIWDEWGIRTPVTVLHLEGVQVVSVVKTSNEMFPRLQIGAGYPKTGEINKPLSFHFKKHGVAARTTLAEFPVPPDAVLQPG